MLKKIFNYIFNSSLTDKKIIFKDVFLTDDNENINRLIRLIQKTETIIVEDSIIIDIGAYNGGTAKLFAESFPKTTIIGFEANPKMHEVAKTNCARNKNITIHNCAVSNKQEQVAFYITSNDVSSSLNQVDEIEMNNEGYSKELNLKNKVTIASNTLDNFINKQQVLIIKIDTQGNELKVIEGARKTLQNTKFVLLEMSNHSMYINGCKYFEVDEQMRKNNFTLIDIIVTHRKKGVILTEYDAIYLNNNAQSF